MSERTQDSAGDGERSRGSGGDLQSQHYRSENQTIQGLRKLIRIPFAVGGLILLGLLTAAAIFAPYLTPYEYNRMSPTVALQPPSAEHLLGTDLFGRDQLTRILHGGRISLAVGFIAVAIGSSVGMISGAIAGYWGGWIDEIIARVYDILLAFPGILLAVAVIAVLGPNLFNLMIAIGIGTIPAFGRLTRGQFLSVREADYVIAARTIGVSHVKIIVRHILPNTLAPIIVLMTLTVATAILSAAALNFLGLGASPPTPEWGLMLSESREYTRQAWWLATFPGLAIMITVVAINAVGDGLRDALDPWLRGR